jgi:hypothetical protein
MRVSSKLPADNASRQLRDQVQVSEADVNIDVTHYWQKLVSRVKSMAFQKS